MKLSNATVLFSVLVAIPAVVAAWSCGPGGSRYGVVLKGPSAMMLDSILPEQMEMRRRRRQQFLDRAFTRISPQYSITETDEAIQISIDVPGVKAQDVQVTLENDGKVLTVAGRRETQESTTTSNSRSSSKFSQSFTMDPTVDIDQFKANLQNGVLVITAPKDLQRLEQNIRRIPITTDIVNEEEPPEVEDSADVTPSAELDEKPDTGDVQDLDASSN